VFSPEGMGDNREDLGGVVFLPELLYRHSFPGCVGLDLGALARSPRPPLAAGRNWVMEIWATNRRPRSPRTWHRAISPVRLGRLAHRLRLDPPLAAPHETDSWAYQAASWYQPLWPRMRAFALPTNSDGMVRLNVATREAHGVVPPDNFARECGAIARVLAELRDPDSGKRVVAEVIPTRARPHHDLERGHPADLVVRWSEAMRDLVASPTHGRLGPVPYHRAGGHRPDGFVCAAGPGIEPGSTFPLGSPMDVAPTVRTLLGLPPADHPGRSLVDVRGR